MSANVTLILVAAALIGCGVYLILERSLTRVLIGVVLIGNGANVCFLVAGGRAGGAPLVGETPEGQMSDPLPQALVLTAIVISLATIAFLLAMAHRSWQLNGHDDVQDDVEDAAIRRRAATEDADDEFSGHRDSDVEVFEEEGAS